MKTVRDIMTPTVTTVSPDTTVEELGRLFLEKGISGAPVIGPDGGLFGIVTENDLIRRNRRFHIPTVVRLFDALIPLEKSSAVEEEIRQMSASKVSEICTRKVITVGPDASLQDVATIMYEKGVHLIPVVDSGSLIGIIGKLDLIKGTMGEGKKQ
ncbi:MAG: CBS domain-containing protein [Nitrospiraceae bacterium]|nr:CBS domain-containing protein [Nitrospiraceae bacterium]